MKPAAQVEAEAAAWLAKRDSGRWLVSDQFALDEWVAACPENRVALLRLQAVWDKADRLRVLESEFRHGSDAPRWSANDGIPETDASPLPTSFWGACIRRYVPIAAAAGLAALALPMMFLVQSADIYSTPVGGFQRLPLPDKSRIELNTDTRLGVAYSGEERRIEMDHGEAFFEVAKDRTRPFVVFAGDYQVTAVGTAFSVRLNGDKLNVAVAEGRIRVDRVRFARAPQEVGLVPAGYEIDGTTAAAVIRPVPAVELEDSLGWREGLLILDNRTLDEVAAEFNRYNRRQLAVDASAAGIKISGTFRADNLDGFLRFLKQGFDVSSANLDTGEVQLKRS